MPGGHSDVRSDARADFQPNGRAHGRAHGRADDYADLLEAHGRADGGTYTWPHARPDERFRQVVFLCLRYS